MMVPGALAFWQSVATGLVLVLGGLATFLGIAIAYHAYRGYQRNQSRPMYYLAIGFVIISLMPLVIDVFANIFWTRVGDMRSIPYVPLTGHELEIVFVPITEYGVQIVGYLFVLYSLYVE